MPTILIGTRLRPCLSSLADSHRITTHIIPLYDANIKLFYCSHKRGRPRFTSYGVPYEQPCTIPNAPTRFLRLFFPRKETKTPWRGGLVPYTKFVVAQREQSSAPTSFLRIVFLLLKKQKLSSSFFLFFAKRSQRICGALIHTVGALFHISRTLEIPTRAQPLRIGILNIRRTRQRINKS